MRGRVGRGHNCAALQSFAHRRQLCQGSGERKDVPRVGGFKRDPAEQALQIENAIERAAKFLAGDGFLYLRLDGIETGVDFRNFDRRAQQPGAQQALAHRSHGGVDRAEQRDAGIGAGEERFDEFEVAHRDRVQHQAGLPFVESNAVNMAESSALGGADVIEDRAGGSRGCGLAGQAEAFQRQHSKMIFQQRDGVVGGEDPVIERCFGVTRAARWAAWTGLRPVPTRLAMQLEQRRG